MRRVAVTGIGLLTALGVGHRQVWDALLEGRSGVRHIEGYDPRSFRTRLAAEIDGFDPGAYASRRALRMTTRNDQLAIAGAALAVADSEVDLAAHDLERAGLFVGGNKEISNPEHLLESSLVARDEQGRADTRLLGSGASQAFYPLFYVEGLQSASLFYLSQAYGLRGANTYFHGTSDAGATAIGRAFRSVARGETDVAVTGGSDDAASWWTLSKLDGLGVLSDRNDLGAGAFRPYDTERTGSVLGEGAAFLVLEELTAARARGAHVYAEITGFGSTLDADQLMTPEPSGRSLAVAVSRALAEARVDPADVGLVAAHGCATRLGDLSESRALATVFGSDDAPLVTSVKPATGHLVAGAGALNVAVCALAVAAGTVPPTLNLERPDPQCALDVVTGESRSAVLRHAVSVARGLEGQQVALTLSAAA